MGLNGLSLLAISINPLDASSLCKSETTSNNALSFEKIAKLIIKLTNSSSKIKNVKRNGPMPHNGYRSFNVSSLKKAFPNFKYHKISEALYKIKELY